jgi:hypothetical protein
MLVVSHAWAECVKTLPTLHRLCMEAQYSECTLASFFVPEVPLSPAADCPGPHLQALAEGIHRPPHPPSQRCPPFLAHHHHRTMGHMLIQQFQSDNQTVEGCLICQLLHTSRQGFSATGWQRQACCCSTAM